MKFTTTLMVLALFVSVGGYYLYLSPERELLKPTVDMKSMKLFALQEGDRIDWIKTHNREKGNTIVLQREEGKWQIKAPVNYPADQMIAHGLATALKLSSKARRLMPEGEWAEYGLGDPALSISIRTQKQDETRTLYLGDSTQVGDYVFARWADEEEYFLLDSNLKKAFSKSVYTMRHKRIFRSTMKDLNRIFVQFGDENFEMVKMQDAWYWVEPLALLGEKLSTEDVEAIIGQIRELHIKDFLDRETKKQWRLGISVGGNFIQLDDEESFERLLVGDEWRERDAYFALNKDKPPVFLISKTHVQAFLDKLHSMTRAYG